MPMPEGYYRPTMRLRIFRSEDRHYNRDGDVEYVVVNTLEQMFEDGKGAYFWAPVPMTDIY